MIYFKVAGYLKWDLFRTKPFRMTTSTSVSLNAFVSFNMTNRGNTNFEVRGVVLYGGTPAPIWRWLATFYMGI